VTGTKLPERRSRSRLPLVVAIALVAVTIAAGVAAVPVDHAFSGTFSLPRLHLNSYTLHKPQGATVTGTWAAVGGGRVHFDIVDGTNYPIYQTNGTSGSFSFPATAPPYGFAGVNTANVTDTVSVTGSYSAPLL
jgi:hypothetical protein